MNDCGSSAIMQFAIVTVFAVVIACAYAWPVFDEQGSGSGDGDGDGEGHEQGHGEFNNNSNSTHVLRNTKYISSAYIYT